MSKDVDDLLKVVGVVVLGKIVWDALKGYRCPRCNYPVSKDHYNCPNCGQPLDWRFPK